MDKFACSPNPAFRGTFVFPVAVVFLVKKAAALDTALTFVKDQT